MAGVFQPKFIDLVRNYTTTEGVGDFALGPAVNGFTGFTDACGVEDQFYYSAIGVDNPAETEVGRGTLLANGVIGRDPISGVKTNFTAGTKSIALIAAAEWFTANGAASARAATSAADRSALAELSQNQVPALLLEAGREGLFKFSTADLSTEVAADAQQGLYVAPSSDPTGAHGAWKREFTGAKDPRWFGAVLDAGITDSAVALQAWLDSGGDLLLPYSDGTAWFRSSQTLYVRRIVHLHGETPYGNDSRPDGLSGYEHVPGSRIVFDAGVPGLDVQTSTTLTSQPAVLAAGSAAFTQQGAFNSSFRDFGIIGLGGAAADGITVRNITNFNNVRVAQFSGRGWYYTASTVGTDADYGNLSNSVSIHCSAESNGSHGLEIVGADANTCLFDAFSVDLSGGDGIRLAQFVGCVLVKPKCAANSGYAINTVSTANNVIIHPYLESGSTTYISDNNLVIGDITPLNAGGLNPAIIASNLVQSANVLAKGVGFPLVVNSTNSNGPKIALEEAGTVRGYIGSEPGIDVTLVNADGTSGFKLYSTGNARRVEIVGGLWGSTAASMLGVTTGWQAYYDTVKGAVFCGGGTSYDANLANKNGAIAIRVPTGTQNVEALGTLKSVGGGIGYGIGAGGAVTQPTSKSTGVTLNKACGQITMSAAALAANSTASFTLINSLVAAGDLLVVNHLSGGTPGAYQLSARGAAAGSVIVDVRNSSAASLAEAIVIGFALIKAVAA